jgi:hypothetical protein
LSAVLIVRTDATDFAEGGVSALPSGTATVNNFLAPVAAIPDLASIAFRQSPSLACSSL